MLKSEFLLLIIIIGFSVILTFGLADANDEADHKPTSQAHVFNSNRAQGQRDSNATAIDRMTSDFYDALNRRVAREERKLRKAQDENYANFLIALSEIDCKPISPPHLLIPNRTQEQRDFDLTDGMDKRAAFKERQLRKAQDENYANFLIALNKSDLNMKDVAKYARDLHMRVDLASKNKEIGVEHYIFILEAIKRMGQGDYQNSPLFGKLHHRKYADDLLMRAELALRNKDIGTDHFVFMAEEIKQMKRAGYQRSPLNRKQLNRGK